MNMTAETLKPFITPQQRVDTFYPSASAPTKPQRSNTKVVAFGLGISAVALATILFGLTCWSLQRVSKLETEVENLNKILGNLHKQLGLNYLDDLHEAEEFAKEYTNALIDDPEEDPTLHEDDDDIDVDEDEDDDDEDGDSDSGDDEEEDTFLSEDYYDELIKKYNSYDDGDEDDDEEDSNPVNVSDDDNLYDDFEKFKDSKKKKQNDFRSNRKARAITEVTNELAPSDETQGQAMAELQQTASSTQHSSMKSQHHEQHPQQQQRSMDIAGTDTSTGNGHAHHRRQHENQRQRRIVGDNLDKRRSPLRPRTNRRHKVPTIKSAESLLSAKTMNDLNFHYLTPAAHFHLHRKVPDRYAAMRVESFTGDMYIGHTSTPNAMVNERFFKHNNGVLVVREPGLYYVYAQICYNNTHDQNGFVIFHGHKPFLQCLNTVPTNMPLKIHTCHTSGLIHLQANETIHLRDFHTDRSVILKDGNNRSYFGIIRI